MENSTEQKNRGSNMMVIVIGVVILAVAGFVYAQYSRSDGVRDERDAGGTMMETTSNGEGSMMEETHETPVGAMMEGASDTNGGMMEESNEAPSGTMMEAGDTSTGVEAGAMMEASTSSR
jgi:hypothetical protein